MGHVYEKRFKFKNNFFDLNNEPLNGTVEDDDFNNEV